MATAKDHERATQKMKERLEKAHSAGGRSSEEANRKAIKHLQEMERQRRKEGKDR